MELVQQPQQPQPTQTTTDSKEAQVYRLADELFQRKPDWVTFYREVMGIEGIIRRAYPTQPELLQFETSKEYADIQQMVAKLRERTNEPAENREPTHASSQFVFQKVCTSRFELKPTSARRA